MEDTLHTSESPEDGNTVSEFPASLTDAPADTFHETPLSALTANAFQAGISGFADTLAVLDEMLSEYPIVHQGVFNDSEEWRRLFQHKLLPQLSADGCLVVAVAGGTNTGKSTLFNLLLRDEKSAACSTAAATCAPVLVTREERCQEGLEGRLLPGFTPFPLTAPEDATRYEMPEDTLWVSSSRLLPETLALLDTPDVDSIERRNWKVADQIRAAGDVVVAVLTPEKYKDARVVDFFRQAHASGRLVVPVMNKANPRENFAAARVQLAEFAKDAALEDPVLFALPFDYDIEHDRTRDIHALDHEFTLMEYLLNLDVNAVKRNVYRDTLEYFLAESGLFLEKAEALRTRLASMPTSFDKHAAALASGYHPQPGESMGTLLHEQIRAQRSAIVRGIARFNDVALRAVQPVKNFVTKRILGASAPQSVSEEERLILLREHQQGHLKRIANDFASILFESARDMEPMMGSLVEAGLEEVQVDEAVNEITRTMLGEADEISEAFKSHVAETVSEWWQGNPAQRRFLMEVDAFMVFAPTAVLVPVAVFTSGVGAPEIMALAGPVAGEFVARIMESRFSEQWVGLLQPWQEEQRARLTECMQRCLVRPALCSIYDVLAVFDYGYLDKLRRYWELCQQGFQES